MPRRRGFTTSGIFLRSVCRSISRPVLDGETGPQLAARAGEAGAFVAMAHPEWYGLTVEEGRELSAAHAVEVYNHTCWAANNRSEGWYLADALLAEGRRVTAIAVDDAHFRHAGDFAGGWVQVKAESLAPDVLLNALKEGAFYSSQGPEITEVDVTDGEIRICCSPAALVVASGRGIATERAEGPGPHHCQFPVGYVSKGRLRPPHGHRRRAPSCLDESGLAGLRNPSANTWFSKRFPFLRGVRRPRMTCHAAP